MRTPAFLIASSAMALLLSLPLAGLPAGRAAAEISGDKVEVLPKLAAPAVENAAPAVESVVAPEVETAAPVVETVSPQLESGVPLIESSIAPAVEPLAPPKKIKQKKALSAEEKKKLAALKAEEERKKKEAALDAPKVADVPFLFGMFDAKKPEAAVLTEEQSTFDGKALDLLKKKPPKIESRFQKLKVAFSGYQPGTVVIDTKKKYLYFVESPIAATRYGVAVGREGLLFTGKVEIGAKQAWPRWIPTDEMIQRDPKQYAQYKDGMEGGPENPLGARAIYLYLGKQDTYLRIHGTNQPNSIGSAASNGCFRMLNEHVIDLYDRVKLGAPVVVI